MAVTQLHRSQDEQKRALVVPSKVLAALDQLDSDEQRSVRRAFSILEGANHPDLADLDIMPLYHDLPVFVLAAAPQVRVILRLPSDAPAEVLDILRPQTLQLLLQGQQGR
jgi:hypothetical protein